MSWDKLDLTFLKCEGGGNKHIRDIFILLSMVLFLYHAGMRPSVHTFVSVRKQAEFEQCLVSHSLISGVNVIFLLILMGGLSYLSGNGYQRQSLQCLYPWLADLSLFGCRKNK